MAVLSPSNEHQRGRGRPRKYPIPDPQAPKRPRGRPRKETIEPAPVFLPELTPEQFLSDIADIPDQPPLEARPSSRAFTDITTIKPSRLRLLRLSWLAISSTRTRRLRVWLRRYRWRLSLSVLTLIMLATTALLLRPKSVHPPTKSSQASNDVYTAVSRLTPVPPGETPRLLKVVDNTKLDQPFLRNAQDGDVLLIFDASAQAILYRPSTDKIVAIGPVNPPSTTTGLQIALYNGSNTPGITANYESKVTGSTQGANITLKEKAARTDYAGNLVVDLSGNHASEAADIAKATGGHVDALPTGEVRPTADILVIIGN